MGGHSRSSGTGWAQWHGNPLVNGQIEAVPNGVGLVGAVTWKSFVNGQIEAILNGVAEKLMDQARVFRDWVGAVTWKSFVNEQIEAILNGAGWVGAVTWKSIVNGQIEAVLNGADKSVEVVSGGLGTYRSLGVGWAQ